MEEELVEEVDNDGGGNWRIRRIWSLFDEIEFVTERNASYKKKKKKNQCRKKSFWFAKIGWLSFEWNPLVILVVILKKNQRLELQYHFPKWKIFFNLMLSDKDGENEKKDHLPYWLQWVLISFQVESISWRRTMPELKEIEAAARTIFSLMLQINQAQIRRVPLDGVFPICKGFIQGVQTQNLRQIWCWCLWNNVLFID